MSSGLNCDFVEVEPSKWYLILEQGSAPKDAWDWYDYADAYGPFPSYEQAHEYGCDHFRNPGGSTILSYDPNNPPELVDDKGQPTSLARLVKDCKSPESRGSRYFSF